MSYLAMHRYVTPHYTFSKGKNEPEILEKKKKTTTFVCIFDLSFLCKRLTSFGGNMLQSNRLQ